MRAHEQRRIEALQLEPENKTPPNEQDEQAEQDADQIDEELFFMDDVVQVKKEEVADAPVNSCTPWWAGWR